MAVEHETRPLWGVQFHPESILSEHGHALLENFRNLTERYAGAHPRGRPAAKPVSGEDDAATGRNVRPHAGCNYRRIGRPVDPAAAFKLLFAGSANAFWLDGAALPKGGFSYMGDDGGPNASVLAHRSGTGITTETRQGRTVTLNEDILTLVQRRLAEHAISTRGRPLSPSRAGSSAIWDTS